MNTSFSTISLLSFAQFADNWLLQRGQAYINNTSQFYYQPDSTLAPNYVAYASPFKSFVWDSGVSGANIIERVSGSFGVLSRGQSGMMIDFVGGRVLLPSSVGTNATVSGSYSFKELNVYFANQSQERMVFTDKYYLNSRFGNVITGLPPAGALVTPCVFVGNAHTDNVPFAFGGLYNTEAGVTLNILAENQTQLQGAMSLFGEMKQSSFPQLPTTAWPLDNYGDYKGGTGYNYVTTQNQYGSVNNLYLIEDVKASAVADYAKVDEALWLGIVDVTLGFVRRLR